MPRAVVRRNTTTCLVLSCTWPAVKSQEEVLNALASLPSFRYAVVSKEAYKQPLKGRSHHYHAHVVFMHKSRIRWALLDDAGGIHGWYQAVKATPLEHLRYVMKEDVYICGSASGEHLFMQDDILRARMTQEERDHWIEMRFAEARLRQEQSERVVALLRGTKRRK